MDPATEAVIGQVLRQCSGSRRRPTAAAAGFEVWRRTPPRDRAPCFGQRPSAAFPSGRDCPLHHPRARQTVRPARAEVVRGAEFFEWDAGEAMRTYGRVIPRGPGVLSSRAPPADRSGAAFSPGTSLFSQPARKVAGLWPRVFRSSLRRPRRPPGPGHSYRSGVPRCGSSTGCAEPGVRCPADISQYLIVSDVIRLVALYRFDVSRASPHRLWGPTT
ncbi:MAG: hypothetical protein CM1200mP26_06680 [Acidimicrobiales bacterium]|nr:MAG: hypothetical protein CM1200mP26_06680 [Acidimicrobiales bacterium]